MLGNNFSLSPESRREDGDNFPNPEDGKTLKTELSSPSQSEPEILTPQGEEIKKYFFKQE